MVAQFPSRSIRVSAADRLPADRLPAKPLFIGVDVSKAWVDIADTDGRRKQVANEVAAIAAAFTGPWSTCANIVCEATGGYERVLMRMAAELALPLRRVHPNRARAFAQATGRLAKTDAADAQMLAQMAAFTAQEPPTPLPSAQAQELAAMVNRLNQLTDLQLTDLRQGESCRAQLAPGARIRACIKTMMKVIDAQIDAMQEAIDAFIAADPTLAENTRLLRSCKGVGPKSAQAILAMLPEIGTLDPRQDRRSRRRRAHHQSQRFIDQSRQHSRWAKSLARHSVHGRAFRKRPQPDLQSLQRQAQSQRQAP